MATLQDQYNSNYSQLKGSGAYNPISMPEQTLEGITDQLAAVMRPQYERAIAQRYGATKKQKAAIDVDAASRGMGTSTWVTDSKNRLMNAEASDIAGLEGDYAGELAGNALEQYNRYLQDKQNLDRYNQSLAIQLGNTAYDRALDAYNAGMIEGTMPAQQQQLAYDRDVWLFGQNQREAEFNNKANDLTYERNVWQFGRDRDQADMQDRQNQLAYDQAQWNFDRARQGADLDDKAAQLAYDMNYLAYLRSQWDFEQAKKGAGSGSGSGRGGGISGSKDGGYFADGQWWPSREVYEQTVASIDTSGVPEITVQGARGRNPIYGNRTSLPVRTDGPVRLSTDRISGAPSRSSRIVNYDR